MFDGFANFTRLGEPQLKSLIALSKQKSRIKRFNYQECFDVEITVYKQAVMT